MDEQDERRNVLPDFRCMRFTSALRQPSFAPLPGAADDETCKGADVEGAGQCYSVHYQAPCCRERPHWCLWPDLFEHERRCSRELG